MTSQTHGERPTEILIVEDSPTQAQQLRELLQMHGYAVRAARNGREALAAVRERRPTLIVSDVVMPEMDGYALCRAIKADGNLRDLPVVLVTMMTDPLDAIRALECGADNLIRKPYDEQYLLARLKIILSYLELRGPGASTMGVEIFVGGRRHMITAERQQILDHLISTYEEFVRTGQELRAKQAQLEAANKELEAFAYSVSHDLRAPLRAIDGFSQVLLEDYADRLDLQGADYLRRVRAASQLMGQLIDDLLMLSRVTRADIRFERVDLSALARTIAGDLQKTHPDRRVSCRIADDLAAQGDPRLLQIALRNLLDNAWKFTRTRTQATVEVGITNRNDMEAFFVQDNGVGFDMAYAGKLFGAFQRLHSPAEFEGTGIGLAIVQRIVQRHGGTVWAEGAAGLGATFFFSLQAHPSAEGA